MVERAASVFGSADRVHCRQDGDPLTMRRSPSPSVEAAKRKAYIAVLPVGGAVALLMWQLARREGGAAVDGDEQRLAADGDIRQRNLGGGGDRDRLVQPTVVAEVVAGGEEEEEGEPARSS